MSKLHPQSLYSPIILTSNLGHSNFIRNFLQLFPSQTYVHSAHNDYRKLYLNILATNFLVSIIIISYFHCKLKLTSAVLTVILHFFRFVVTVIDSIRHCRLKNVGLYQLKIIKLFLFCFNI
jgi:hypothetical protein